jgi:hypothetical protein
MVAAIERLGQMLAAAMLHTSAAAQRGRLGGAGPEANRRV